MRVLHVAEGSRFAGIESHLLTLFAEMRRREIDVALAVFDRGPLAGRVAAMDLPVCQLPRRHKYDRTAVRRLAAWVEEWRPDVVHTHGYLANVVAAHALAGRNTPLVTTVHGAPEPFPGFAGLKMRINLWLDRRVMRRHCRRVIVVAQHLGDALSAAGVSRDKIAVVRNGLVEPGATTVSRLAARRGLELDSTTPVVAFVGRLEPVKDPLAFVDLAAAIRREVAATVFLVAGDGPLHDTMQAAVARAGLTDAFRFLGFLDDLDAVYAAADVLALTSRHEGIPNVALAAMRAGLPVVAPAVGGLPELLASLEGALAPAGDPEALARLAISLLRDPALRTAAGQAGRRVFLDRFTARQMVDELLQVYREAMGKTP